MGNNFTNLVSKVKSVPVEKPQETSPSQCGAPHLWFTYAYKRNKIALFLS